MPRLISAPKIFLRKFWGIRRGDFHTWKQGKIRVPLRCHEGIPFLFRQAYYMPIICYIKDFGIREVIPRDLWSPKRTKYLRICPFCPIIFGCKLYNYLTVKALCFVHRGEGDISSLMLFSLLKTGYIFFTGRRQDFIYRL